ncbi:MAG TPA: aminoglycoside 6-adenylyltransferase [Gaiellaceae bacterium]|nr:aminoglycoside 6-adenylyltransferase [Gaiellaceae bacterium]
MGEVRIASVTGVLLVGGASDRFGSPKALARLRGETLAERGWRILGEAFPERLATGKGELDLPFDVVVEPAEPQAPIAGVVAGLRAAASDTVVCLPVDCPLVTPELLRALGEAGAVPRTGPLPGAYAQAHLPELERRLAAGDLSLRGVNERVLDVDQALLLDVDVPRDLALAAVTAWARERADVRGLVLVGSLARADAPADEWSDVDVIAFVDDPARYLDDDAWVAELGKPVLTFVEPAAVGGIFERRVLLERGVDVDVVLVPVARANDLFGEAAVVLRRGYLVLHDEVGLAARLVVSVATAEETAPLPTEAELENLCADLWYHGLWTAKKLRRGELWTALECLDAHMRGLLLALLRWRAAAEGRPTWHGARFVEEWAGEPAEALAATFGGYDEAAAGRALWAMVDLAGRLERELRVRLGLDPRDRAEAARLIEQVQPR